MRLFSTAGSSGLSSHCNTLGGGYDLLGGDCSRVCSLFSVAGLSAGLSQLQELAQSFGFEGSGLGFSGSMQAGGSALPSGPAQ